jgi:hypothetical protein
MGISLGVENPPKEYAGGCVALTNGDIVAGRNQWTVVQKAG